MADTPLDPAIPIASADDPAITLEIRQCLGLTVAPDGDRPVHLVLQRPSGRLHVLQLDVPTALAIALAIRADIRC